MTTAQANVTDIASLSDKHCIFRCGEASFSIPAMAVREIAPCPDIVTVPVSHAVLAGVGHVRNEFLPVVVLEPLVGDHACVSNASNQLLVLTSALGSWAILIDEIIDIDVVETHVDASHRADDTLSPMLGTASYNGDVISVLDANGLHRVCQQALQKQWN